MPELREHADDTCRDEHPVGEVVDAVGFRRTMCHLAELPGEEDVEPPGHLTEHQTDERS